MVNRVFEPVSSISIPEEAMQIVKQNSCKCMNTGNEHTVGIRHSDETCDSESSP